MLANSPIFIEADRDFQRARFRKTAAIMFAMFAFFGLFHLVEDVQKGGALGSAIGLFLVTTLLGCGLVLLILKVMLSGWSITLGRDGTIQINQPLTGRTIRTAPGDVILCMRSPNGKTWLLQSRTTRSLYARIPLGAFPTLQDEWNKVLEGTADS